MKCPKCSSEMRAVTARDPERAWFCVPCRQHRDKSALANWDGSTEGDDAEHSPDTHANVETLCRRCQAPCSSQEELCDECGKESPEYT